MEENGRPSVVVIGGPNGAGKSTLMPAFLEQAEARYTFVNADDIARGLSRLDPDAVAMEAGRIMVRWLHQLADRRADFAFETTLSTRTFASWLRELREGGYDFALIYLWVTNPETSVQRVARRVQEGGHHVPEETVRRRWARSASNLLRLYIPIADTWKVFANLSESGPELVAEGGFGGKHAIHLPHVWRTIEEATEHA